MVPLRLANLTKEFITPRGRILAVEAVSIRVQAGELFFLLGPSGCGKTTLLRMLAGFVEPTSGRIFFGDRDVTEVSPERRDAAMVFQSYALWPHMTVTKNVAFGPQVRGVPSAQREARVRQLLETVRIAEKASAKPMELSGGQQQRVALARALAVEPRCLLLDEPLSNLDAALRSVMRWEIRRIVKAAGTTTVYVTHDQAEALAIADRIALMREGRIVQVGTGRELYESPASRFVAEFLGEANFLSATSAGAEGAWLLLDTPIGRLRGRACGSVSVERGHAITCCLRPESLRLAEATSSSPTNGDNILSGRLTDWTHLGDSARFRIEFKNGTELSGAAMPARPAASVGQAVAVRIAPEDVIALAE